MAKVRTLTAAPAGDAGLSSASTSPPEIVAVLRGGRVNSTRRGAPAVMSSDVPAVSGTPSVGPSLERCSVAETPLRGRDEVLAVIAAYLSATQHGRGGILFLESPAGLGKTRVLAEAGAIARRTGIRVGGAAMHEGDQVVPVGGLVAALFDGREPLVDPSARRWLPYLPEQRYWLLEELESLLEETALRGPVLVCLDDAHWGDGGTLTALRTLPRHLADVPIVWVVSFRGDHSSAELRTAIESLDDIGSRTLVLDTLDAEAVAQVVEDVMGAVPDTSLLELARRAGGSPFLLVELVRGLQEEGLVRVDSGHAVLVEARLPARVTDSMRDRLSQMSDPAHQVALVATVLGQRFSFAHLSIMLSKPASELLAPVDELLRADLLTEYDGELTYRHDLIREAVRDTLPPTARRALERQAVDALLTAGSPPLEVAAQLAASAERGDRAAVRTLREAALALGSSDAGSAADLSRRALEVAGPEDPLRGALAAETALLLHAAGRIQEGKAFAHNALGGLLSSDQEAGVHLSIAWMTALSPDVRVEIGRRALGLPGLSSELRARHLARLPHNLISAGRLDDARKVLGEARNVVRSSGDPDATLTLALSEAALEYASGNFESALDQIDVVTRRPSEIMESARELTALRLHAELLAAVDSYEESLILTTDRLVACQRAHQGWSVRTWEEGRGCRLFQLGRLGEASGALKGIVASLEEVTPVGILDVQAVLAAARVAMHVGSEAEVRKCAAIAEALLKTGTLAGQCSGAWLLALVAMWEGDAFAARDYLAALGETKRLTLLPLFPMDVTDEVSLARIALATGDDELASCAVAAAQERCRLNPKVASIAGTAAHALGLVAGDADRLAVAVKLFEQGPRPLALASALEDAGNAFVARGDRDKGIALLGNALEVNTAAGSSWDAGRVRGRLRALGIRRRLTASAQRRHGWSGLTQSQLDVARLVAQGLTNRETGERLFLSQYTVGAHLRQVFAKLDIRSRVDLARLIAKYDDTSGASG